MSRACLRNVFHHGIVMLGDFYENVPLHIAEGRELQPSEKGETGAGVPPERRRTNAGGLPVVIGGARKANRI